jgi:hypothetical protein
VIDTGKGLAPMIVATREVLTGKIGGPGTGHQSPPRVVCHSSLTGRILQKDARKSVKNDEQRIKSEISITITVPHQKKTRCRPGRTIS